jgi:DNA-binding CsgD family transcriptional regulator
LAHAQQAAYSCALVISAQRSPRNSTKQRRSSAVFNPLNRWRPFCDEALALMIYKRDFLPSVSAPGLALGLEAGPVLQITPSERDALQLLAQEVPTSEIGAMLGLSPADIDPFLGALFTRLGVGSHADAITVASRRGLLVP